MDICPSLDEMLAFLPCMSRAELQRLAAEALLLSDGVDAPHEIHDQEGSDTVAVYLEGLTISDTGTADTVRFHVAVKVIP